MSRASNILVNLLGDASSLTRSFRQASRSAQGFNKGMRQTGRANTAGQKSMRGLGSSVRLAGASFLGGAGVVAGITSTLTKTAEFERSLNTFQAVSKATAAQMKAVGAQATQLGSDIGLPGTSAKDAAEAMVELTKAGLSVPQVQKAVRATLLLSAAASVDNARAAEIASNTLNAFNLDAAKTPKVVDVLAAAANASSIEIDDAALSFQQASAVFSSFQGKALGAEGALKEMAISVGLLGSAGIKGSDAGTSLKTMLLRLAAPTNKAKNLMRDLLLVTGGNAEAQDLFRTSVEGSSKKIRDLASNALEKLQGSAKGAGDIAYNAAGQMRPLHEIVTRLGAATKGMTEEQRNFIVNQLFGSDAARAAIILLDKQGKKYDEMKTAVNTAGSAHAIAAAKMKGLAGAMDALKSSIETVQITIGTALTPALTKFLQSAAKWVGDTKNQKAIMDTLKTTMTTVGTVLENLRTAFGALSRFVGGSKRAIFALLGMFVLFKAAKMAASVYGVARSFGLLGRNAGTAGGKMGGARGGAAALKGSLVGKAGLVGAVGAASFALTTLILKATGFDKWLKKAGGSVADFAAKLHILGMKDPMKQFEGKKILGQKDTRFLRQKAARLEAQGLTPQQAAQRIVKQHPKVALRDAQVLAGVFGSKPQVVTNNYNTTIDGRRDDAETLARKVTEAQLKAEKRNTIQRRGAVSGR